jgi:hypothetical protein
MKFQTLSEVLAVEAALRYHPITIVGNGGGLAC